MKKIVLFALAVLFLSACSSKKNEPIKIGLISVFSGDGAYYGTTAKTGVDLAIAEINHNGGINGKKIEILYEDTKGTSIGAVNAFQKLSSINKLSAIIGPFYSGQVLACAPIANSQKTVLLTGSATSDNITKAGEYVFRVCPTNEVQASTAAKFIINDLKLKTAYILYRNGDYGVTLRDKFKDSFQKLGGKILGEDAVDPEATNVRPQLLKVKEKNPDVIFAAVHYTEGGNMLNQIKELNIKSKVVGTDGGFDPNLIKIAKSNANGSYWLTIGWGMDSISQAKANVFKKDYLKKYGELPGVYSALYYDAAYVLADALKKVNKISGQEIKDTLLEMKPYHGVTGINKFDKNGDVNKQFSIYEVENQKFNQIK